jgi:outer membrane protein assembly factor BamB
MNALNKSLFLLIALLVCGWIAFGQSRGGNWPTYGGDAQRSGWEGADAAITTESIKNLQLLWKMKLEVAPRGMRPVMPPVILGRLISYRGFKELAFVATNADIVYAIDADLGAMFWQKHLEYSTRQPQVMTSTGACPGGLTAMPTMPVPGARGAAGGRGAPAPTAGAPRGSAFIGGPASVYTISSDGRLHRLNTSTGDDMTQPISVIPANARATSLNMVDNVIYTVTSHECNGDPNAVWAIDLNVDPPKVRSFALKGGGGWGIGGPVIGSDGSVYIQTGRSNSSATVVAALTQRELQLKQSSSTGGSGIEAINAEPAHGASPVVFSYKDRDLIAAVCFDHGLCILDSASGKEIYRSPQLVLAPRSSSTAADVGFWGSLSSWQDTDGTRWVLASALGPPHSDLKATANGPTPNGFIAAFKVQEQNNAITLAPAWISRDLDSPLPPVIANGVVFALSAGEFTRQVKTVDGGTTVDERPKGATRATLYALDARTGKELYSSRNLATGPASLTGLTVANGRVYFGGLDGTLYAFGMYVEH